MKWFQSIFGLKSAGRTREFQRACNVYCRPEANQAVVASMYNHGGMMAEKPGGASICDFENSSALNLAISTAIQQCEYRENFNYANRKSSDWPAFQASGYKTIKRFEAEFIHFSVVGLNDKNFFYEIQSPEFGAFGLRLKALANAYKPEFGEAVQFIARKYLAYKDTTT